ncbi:hypothetical protein CRYUN_Cryun03dG0167200 [Craigia yunnanensis]
MATASTNPQRKKKETRFPPRRGQIKAQIFESLVKTVVSAASKAKEALGKTKKAVMGRVLPRQPLLHHKVAITPKEMETYLRK